MCFAKKHLAAKPCHLFYLAHQVIAGHPPLLYPTNFPHRQGLMLKTATSRGAQRRMRGPLSPRPAGNVQRPCRRLIKPVRIRAGTLRQPQPFQPRHMKLPRMRVPGQNEAGPIFRQKLHSRGLVHKPQPESRAGLLGLSGNRRFAVAGVSYFMVERPRMSTFCPLISTRAASFCKG